MAEWLGHLMSDWPFWVVMGVACIAAVLWIVTQAVWYGGLSPFERKEWWQDREKRLKNNASRKQMKVKKG